MAIELIRQVDLVRIFLIALMFVSSIFALPAAAQPVWICTYQPQDKGVDAVTNKFVETSAKVLSAYTDDYTGKPALYDIVENSDDGLIAVSHYSRSSGSGKGVEMGLSTIFLNKRTGDFRQYGYLVRTRFEDRYDGKCALELLRK